MLFFSYQINVTSSRTGNKEDEQRAGQQLCPRHRSRAGVRSAKAHSRHEYHRDYEIPVLPPCLKETLKLDGYDKLSEIRGVPEKRLY